MLVVTNSSPIILLSRVKRLDVLTELYPRIVVPKAVYHEVVELGSGMPGSEELRTASWADVQEHDPDNLLHRSLSGDLGAGEAAAITMASVLEAELHGAGETRFTSTGQSAAGIRIRASSSATTSTSPSQ